MDSRKIERKLVEWEEISLADIKKLSRKHIYSAAELENNKINPLLGKNLIDLPAPFVKEKYLPIKNYSCQLADFNIKGVSLHNNTLILHSADKVHYAYFTLSDTPSSVADAISPNAFPPTEGIQPFDCAKITKFPHFVVVAPEIKDARGFEREFVRGAMGGWVPGMEEAIEKVGIVTDVGESSWPDPQKPVVWFPSTKILSEFYYWHTCLMSVNIKVIKKAIEMLQDEINDNKSQL